MSPLAPSICVIPLFGLDMGATWAKSILSRLLGGNPWGRTEAKVSSPGMSPLTANMCYSVVWARYGRDLGQINPLKPWGHTENVVWAQYGRDLGAIYVYCVLLRCLGSICVRLAIRALGMSLLAANMCYSVVWARYGRDLCLLCVITLFGLDMGATCHSSPGNVPSHG